MAQQKKNPWVTASEVGEWVYCPESWRLKQNPDFQNLNAKRMAEGERAHQIWQEQRFHLPQGYHRRPAHDSSGGVVIFFIILLFVLYMLWS